VATHTISFDHTSCQHHVEYDEDGDLAEDHWCSPEMVAIGCSATRESEPEADCRFMCQTCETFAPCDGGCASYEHADPGVKHCTEGHLYEWLDDPDCNYVLWLNADPSMYDELYYSSRDRPVVWYDGAIVPEWDGDGVVWSYAEEPS
jgi:hypothetical protein